jgi:plasmid stability protein
MTQIILENLDPIVVEKLQVRATRQGRSLLEELKVIVEEAVEFETIPAPQETMKEARVRLAKVRQQYQGRTFKDSTELSREDRQR